MSQRQTQCQRCNTGISTDHIEVPPDGRILALCNPCIATYQNRDWRMFGGEVELEELGPAVYNLHSYYSREAINVTAQGLLDLGAWIEQNKEELQRSAQQRARRWGQERK